MRRCSGRRLAEEVRLAGNRLVGEVPLEDSRLAVVDRLVEVLRDTVTDPVAKKDKLACVCLNCSIITKDERSLNRELGIDVVEEADTIVAAGKVAGTVLEVVVADMVGS